MQPRRLLTLAKSPLWHSWIHTSIISGQAPRSMESRGLVVNGPMNPCHLGQLATNLNSCSQCWTSTWISIWVSEECHGTGTPLLLLSIHATDMLLPLSQHFQEQGQDSASILLNHTNSDVLTRHYISGTDSLTPVSVCKQRLAASCSCSLSVCFLSFTHWGLSLILSMLTPHAYRRIRPFVLVYFRSAK